MASKSKIPPQFGVALAEVLQATGDEIELFCFHAAAVNGENRDYTGRRRCAGAFDRVQADCQCSKVICRLRAPLNSLTPTRYTARTRGGSGSA